MTEVQKLKMQYGKLKAKIQRLIEKLPKKYIPLANFAQRGAILNRDAWEIGRKEERRITFVNQELTTLCKMLEKLV